MSKLYAGILGGRLSNWASSNNIISPMQKGFMEFEGCLEHNFVLQSIIDNARRHNKEVYAAWLDLSNAFGSVPHEYMKEALRQLGVPEDVLEIIADMYHGSVTRVRTGQGYTNDIELEAGVKQGCPLSPILFNLAIEPIIRAITNLSDSCGAEIHSRSISILAYADDFVLAARNELALQRLLRVAGDTAKWAGLTFNPKKCASLSIDCRKTRDTLPTVFFIQGTP